MTLKETINKVIGFSPDLVKISDLIKSSNKIAILGHSDPDIDCISSQLALNKALENMGKESYTVNNGPFENGLSIYKDFFKDSVDSDTDLIIVVDNSSVDRISSNNKIDLTKTVVIDHHYTNTCYGIINYVDDSFISASEMVLLTLAYLDIDLSNSEIPQWILNGILSDNGYFRHIRVNKFFSLIASYFLIKLGADPDLAYKNMFCNNKVNDIKLLGSVFNRIESTRNDLIIWTYIDEKDKEIYHSNVSSLFLFKEMMTIKDGKIFVFFKIIESENKVIVSFRSDEKYNVGAIAEKLGGGGHKVASGAGMSGTYNEVKEKVIKMLEELVDSVK